MTKTYRFEVAVYIAVEADSRTEAAQQARKITNLLHAMAPTGARVGIARAKRS